MADGIKYTEMQNLIDAVKSFIFPNKKKLITGVKHQQAVLCTIGTRQKISKNTIKVPHHFKRR